VASSKEKLPEMEEGKTRSFSLRNWLRKRLWTSPKTDYVVNE
jgi:hypothetical protein